MKLVLATGNKGKLREFKQMYLGNIIPYSDILEEIEIIEDGDTFAKNAFIKANTIYEKLGKEYIVIADDSGISLPILNNEPNIYSARYAGENASDKENLEKLISKVKERGITKTDAYYTSAISLVSSYGNFTVHGWMYGEIVTTPKGENGFGYDPTFIPYGFNKTLGEIEDDVKAKISHRAKALKSIIPIINMIEKQNL